MRHRYFIILSSLLLQSWMPSAEAGAGDIEKPAALRIVIRTEKGDIEVELDAARAPKTAANFLRYVDAKLYDGGRFHRTVKPDNQPDNKVKIEVVQAGINPGKQKDEFAPIKLERTRDTGIKHADGTISMARDGPDTATSDLFLCVGDQPELDFGGKRNPDGQGFAAFGRVVKGMDVVRAIQAAPAEGQALTPPIKILDVTRVALGGELVPRVRTLEGHTGSVMAVAFSPDGKVLASSSRDKSIKLWNARTGEVERTFTEHTGDVYDVVFSPKGELLASGGRDKTIILWESRTGKIVRTLRGHDDIVRSLAFSPDQKTLASGSVDQTVRLWDVATGELKQTLKGHTARVMSVVYSPDGSLLASASSDKSARLWDAQTGKLRRVLEGHSGGLECIDFSPDGKLLASSSQDATVRLWDVSTGEVQHTLKGHEGEIDSVGFSPNGKMLASGCKDKTLKLWDVRTGKLLQTLTGHTGRVESLEFSPDGKTLATGGGGGDTSVKLWDLTKK